MEKLVKKTIGITFAGIIGAMIIAFTVTAIVAPSALGKFFDGVGNYSATVLFYKNQYKKTGNVEDLAVLVAEIQQERDAKLWNESVTQLVNHKDFDEYCKSKGENEVKYKEFYLGEYAYALAIKGRFEEALAVADQFVVEYGYTLNNPFIPLIDFATTQPQISGIVNSLNQLKVNLSGEQLELINSDIEQLSQKLIS